MTEATTLSVGSDEAYTDYLHRSHLQFLANLKQSNGLLFKTNAEVSFDKYLAKIPQGVRQYHTCTACRHFVEQYGSLACINEMGELIPAMWEPGAAFNVREVQEAVTEMYNAVKKARVTGVFYTKDMFLGTPNNVDEKRGCTWHHMSAMMPVESLYRDQVGMDGKVMTAGQKSAEKKEQYGMVCRALAKYSLDTLSQAVVLLSAEALYRSEAVLGQAQWLLDLQQKRAAMAGPRRENLTWVAVAKAPAGFCHPSTSMIGTLLDDLAAGLAVSDVKKKFDKKMEPLKYQRPQAAPKQGTIDQAEKIVEVMGLAPSLERRFARLDEVPAIWKPTTPAEAGKQGGVFQHLKPGPKKGDKMEVPMRRMTWDKFNRDILPQAKWLELNAPTDGNYTAMTTCMNADAPPLLQWDEEPRNPVSWYLYAGGSPSMRWSLRPGFVDVLAITEQPNQWYGKEEKFKHRGKALFFILKGCMDTDNHSLAIFPEHVRSELHGARSVIEAYSRSKSLPAVPLGVQLASGIKYEGRHNETVQLRVDIGDGALHNIIIDRWE